MASLNTQSFTQIVQGFAAGVQSRATVLIDFSVGSILRSVAESFAAVALWLQALIVQVLAITRLSTSTGSDVDSFVADFGLTRFGAIAATGLVTFSRFTTSVVIPFIPVGTTVKTSDGTQIFTVYADTTNTAYSSVLGGYNMAAGTSSVTVPVAAQAAGANGNVNAGSISLIASPVSGVDTVTNPAAFTNGSNFETDTALKARFQLFIASLAEGTVAAIKYAVVALQTGMQVAVHENVTTTGSTQAGMVTVYIDDGSGSPPASLVALAATAVNSVRAAGIQTAVYGATPLPANITMTLTTAAGYTHQTVIAQVAAALGAAINARGLEVTLPYTLLSSVAYGVAGVTNVSGILLNSSTVDLIPSFGQTIKVGSLVIS